MAERPAGWRLNLQANPEASVQIGATVRRYRGRLAGEDEITRCWPTLLEQWPPLESYRQRSGVRYVFVLGAAAYCSSVTCSLQVTGLPESSTSCMARCAMKRFGAAPCQ